MSNTEHSVYTGVCGTHLHLSLAAPAFAILTVPGSYCLLFCNTK